MVRSAVPRRAGLVAVVAVIASLIVAVPTPHSLATVSPVVARTSSAVTADGLPTVQIDGVVWSQAVVGNTVYAGGSFANARPAGAAPGTQLTPRGNLMAYNIDTGKLIESFAPTLNAQIRSVTASPDGTRIYVGGSFTQADGQNRYRIAAYSTSSGALISSFAPTLDATVNSITATNSVVYAGGVFGTANGVARSRLAAFSAADGSLLNWAPTTNDAVNAVQLTPDQSEVIVGGAFTKMSSTTVNGLGAADATSGAILPWAANRVVRHGEGNSSILSLSTDGKSIFGTGHNANLEGVFSASPDTGQLNWIEDCHGDSYGAAQANGVVYVVSHEHFCGNIGGFPETAPDRTYHRTTAFTADATGKVQHNSEVLPGNHYYDFNGHPSPSLIDWFPNLDVGTYTGQLQAAWTVDATSQYVVEGGEFQHVNGVGQQGLVRFAVPSLAPQTQGPQVTDSTTTPYAAAHPNDSARITWQANWDPDDEKLTYALYRADIGSSNPIYTTEADSTFWSRPAMSYLDSGLTPGTTYTYWIRATDPSGNSVRSANVTMTASDVAPASAYASDVLARRPTHYWRLGESGGSQAVDTAGSSSLVESGTPTQNVPGAISQDPDAATGFSSKGTTSASTIATEPARRIFSIGAWIKTKSKSGGDIVSFSSQPGVAAIPWIRSLYLADDGQLVFGIDTTSGIVSVESAQSYNDGAWHQVVASVSSSKMTLYVDGSAVGAVDAPANGYAFNGYWHIGQQALPSWPSEPSAKYLTADLDEVATYPSALTATAVAQQFAAGTAPTTR